VSEGAIVELAAPTPDVPSRGGLRAALRRRSVLWGLALLVAGAAGLAVSLVALTASAGLARYVVAAVAVAALYLGLDVLTRRFWGDRVDLDLWLSGAWLGLVVAAAASADVLPLAESRDISKTITQPILVRPDLLSEHPLGTDGQGLDILGGILYGARVSLVIGVGAVVIGMIVGVAIGMAAGYHRGRVDTAVSFLTDSLLAFPPLIFLLALAAAFAPSISSVTIALAVLAVPTFIRLARANTLVFGQREFVLSARLLGERNRSIIARDLLPNVLLPVASFGFLLVAAFIVAEASLSFLGLSVSRPNPTWGNMIAAGQSDFQRDPHVVFVPGTALFFTVFAFNRVGDFARSRWDPREAKL
jgi:peptide/nickel transport system permease protein